MVTTLLRAFVLFFCLSVTVFADETGQELSTSTPETSQAPQADGYEAPSQARKASQATGSSLISQTSHLYPEEKDTVRLKFLSQKRNEIIQEQAKLSKKIRSIQSEQEEQERAMWSL